MKKQVILFLLCVGLYSPSVFAGSRAVIHGSIEPIVIPEIVSMEVPQDFSTQAALQPSFDTNAPKKNFFPQTLVEHIGGVTVYSFIAL